MPYRVVLLLLGFLGSTVNAQVFRALKGKDDKHDSDDGDSKGCMTRDGKSVDPKCLTDDGRWYSLSDGWDDVACDDKTCEMRCRQDGTLFNSDYGASYGKGKINTCQASRLDVPCLPSFPDNLITPCGTVDLDQMRRDDEQFMFTLGVPLFPLPANAEVMERVQMLGLFCVVILLALLFAGGCLTPGINETWGDLQDLLIGGFPKIDDNTSLLSKAEIDGNNHEKKVSSGPDFIAYCNYYRMMAMMVIVNPPDISYTLWAQSTFKVLVVLAAQVSVPFFNLYLAASKISHVEVATFQDMRFGHFIALLTATVWMNKVLITKVDDALGANCYILDKWYVEPDMAEPKYSKELRAQQMQRGICGRVVVKHFWCALSFGVKVFMSLVINLNAILLVAEFYGSGKDMKEVFVAIASIYVAMELDVNAVVADGHAKQRYRTYVVRLQDEPPVGQEGEHQPLLSMGARHVMVPDAQPPSYWYTQIFGWYKYCMRAASLIVPVFIFVIKVQVLPGQ